MPDPPVILSRYRHRLQDEHDLEVLLDAIGPARVVMLGESTHGTSEFYDWRRRISQRLISELGFSFIAVEGDWPDGQRVNAFVTMNRGTAIEALTGYRRFPTWMWGNMEVLELVNWLREHNRPRTIHRSISPDHRPVGFHGLDVYSLHDSMRLVVEYLERVDPAAAALARRAYGCFDEFGSSVDEYARGTRWLSSSCKAQVHAALVHMEQERLRYSRINPDHVDPGDAYFDAAMNARVTHNAEAYYRTMLQNDAESWNIRDRHMMETLTRLLEHYGPRSRAIVWAHNTHIGDYRGTDMIDHGYVNIGGLAREQLGQNQVFLLGITTHGGTVMASAKWGEEGQVMTIPEPPEDSLEGMLHQYAADPIQLIMLRGMTPAERADANRRVEHRAIGVVYDPARERFRNYVPTHLVDRYDAIMFIDHTTAVRSLEIPADQREEAEAYPTGL